MGSMLVRKNFKFDKDLIDKVSNILEKKNKNFTQILVTYFQAITKEPELLDTLEKKAKERKGSFIGMLDGKIGDVDFKEMKGKRSESIS